MIKAAYEDQWLKIVDKPAGLLVIPTPKNERHTLTNMLGLRPCHRLDRDTSGLIIYAKGKTIQKKMMDEFKNRRVKKTYIAFVRGRPARRQGQITNPIDGQSALTRYKVIGEKEGFSVVEVSPVTGRKNQIRIHFKQLGNPLLGETRFAFRRDFKIKARRLCLHAKGLEFTHPVTNGLIRVESELPDKMKQMLERR
ncbi:MAG: RNA pseudouridine synthase [Candidatus Omnitrophica bacterium]|nr:RNA pseudouridine synthase [Candidatus Omnitrophota bacterium]